MNSATNPAKQTEGEAEHRLSPLEAFVAWVATFIAMITGMKRRKVFPPNWRDHWQGLRELEWYRDQILGFSASHVFAGGSLEDRTDHQLIMDVPDGYGVCPSTPEAMNRRFILAAAFNLNPNRFILRHIQRIAKREGIALIMDDVSGPRLARDPLRRAARATSPGYAGGGKPLASLSRLATGGGGMRVLHAHDGGGLAFSARGPPPDFSCHPQPHLAALPGQRERPLTPASPGTLAIKTTPAPLPANDPAHTLSHHIPPFKIRPPRHLPDRPR